MPPRGTLLNGGQPWRYAATTSIVTGTIIGTFILPLPDEIDLSTASAENGTRRQAPVPKTKKKLIPLVLGIGQSLQELASVAVTLVRLFVG